MTMKDTVARRDLLLLIRACKLSNASTTCEVIGYSQEHF
jgi:hypothetical protein